MYLRTPKRYQQKKRRVHLVSTRWLWLWILTPLVVIGGYLVYLNADEIGPPIRQALSDGISSAGGSIATMVAPTPLPTSDPTERLAAADALWMQGAIGQAVEEYGALVANAPNDVRSHYRYTYGLLVERRSAEALTASERAVNANPFSADAWAIRAWALSRNGFYAQAIAAALQALSIDADHAPALAFMAEAYLDAEQTVAAEERINQALSADPENAEAYYVRGLWNVAANFDFTAARDDFSTAHDLAPNMPNIMVERAWADWSLQNYDVGLDTLEQVLESNPNNLDALYALGYFQYQVYGDPNKASDYLGRCLVADPQNISCLNYMATVQIGLGNPEAAAEHYQRIVDTGTQDPIYFLRAGRTYADLGDCRRATPLLRTGLGLEQESEVPDVERLAAFEEYLIQCGAPLNPQFADPAEPETEATEESLLVPLGSS
ncbi:MAG: tetratricopeptide repeat protein [Chloroflexi bacterium]|nr:tetratricopeptide repeat protein [Chloroflexota bacterium]